jgi:hypothetical protein
MEPQVAYGHKGVLLLQQIEVVDIPVKLGKIKNYLMR